MAFEFDPGKSAANKDKHGIDFDAAQALWFDDRRVEIAGRSDVEPRFLLIGAIGGKLWSAVFTVRGDRIRLISVRPSRGSEVGIYESE